VLSCARILEDRGLIEGKESVNIRGADLASEVGTGHKDNTNARAASRMDRYIYRTEQAFRDKAR
jgi:hypothetical protein